MSAKKFPLNPARPDRVCWGCDLYCPVENMACGNGADRTQHPSELFGPDWMHFGLDAQGDRQQRHEQEQEQEQAMPRGPAAAPP